MFIIITSKVVSVPAIRCMEVWTYSSTHF